jgi:hypothetical protein
VTQQFNTKRHVNVATVVHATIEELWEAVSSERSMQRLHLQESRLEVALGGRHYETAETVRVAEAEEPPLL